MDLDCCIYDSSFRDAVVVWKGAMFYVIPKANYFNDLGLLLVVTQGRGRIVQTGKGALGEIIY